MEGSVGVEEGYLPIYIYIYVEGLKREKWTKRMEERDRGGR